MIFLFLLTLFGNADLTKTVSTKGVSATHLKLSRYCVDKIADETIVTYQIYVNEAAETADKNNYLDGQGCILKPAVTTESAIETAVVSNCDFFSGATKK